MVSEYQFLSAAMQIILLAEVMLGNGRILNVPAGTAVAPWRMPSRLISVILGFPKNKIPRIILVAFQFDSYTLLQLIQFLCGKFCVGGYFFKGKNPRPGYRRLWLPGLGPEQPGRHTRNRWKSASRSV